MGERHSCGGQAGRRRAHPDGTPGAPAGTALGESELETRFGAALRAGGVDPAAERGAVTAFRAARAAGAHDARTRARDDWRPGRPRRARRSLRTTLSLALASLTLGGVAVAAIGSARSGTEHGGGHAPGSARPSSTSAPSTPSTPAHTAPPAAAGRGDTPSAAPSAPSGQPAHPATAGDTLAHCRAYAQVGERGGALDATAWRRLVTAAGGPGKVAAYCTAQAARAEGGSTGRAGGSGNDRSEDKGGGRRRPTGGKP
ncbi:hypothetical protein [Streptomyces cinerochromogenes]|uniref:hypothetical protein n=1 Tax=Streptomyces cinerochromogenes TaxID=66422 RepID=UPI0019840CFF|nr:hypothetical protein [Streptomyces cinerochromogenes]GGS65571.1 hypothetical protein GCM10010206_30070 [Streptomyces cinerochromogenes]